MWNEKKWYHSISALLYNMMASDNITGATAGDDNYIIL